MSPLRRLPYGLWPSPISPGTLCEARRLQDVCWGGDGDTLVWLEGRSGRGVLVCAGSDGDAPRDLTSELSVRARVGYGGGDMTAAGGRVYFVSEGRLFRQPLGYGVARPITPVNGGAVAAPAVAPDGRWVVYVYSVDGEDGLGVVDAEGRNWPQRLAGGTDFFMQPVWHPDGRHLAWVSWNHPNMPWDGAELHLATLETDGPGLPRVVEERVVAGDARTTVFQPEFSPDGRFLSYVSDASGWDRLYLLDLARGGVRQLTERESGEAEYGRAAWAQGMRTYAWSPDGATIYVARSERGYIRLWAVDAGRGVAAPVEALAAYSDVSQVTVSRRGRVALIGSAPGIPTRVLVYDPIDGAVRVAARSETETIPPAMLPSPEAITWESEEGEPVHGLYYAPDATRYTADGAPPLIVLVHGGPTSQSVAGYSGRNAFFTTRGYGVLEVNYRGSSGYGRRYRDRLRGQWGVYDVADAVGGALHLARLGRADRERLVIMGGSAGGYTVLEALAQHPGVFRAGICMYGVTNLFTLASDTHKFEQHYLDSLIGPLPEAAARYRERSPIYHADRIRDPLAVFQGEDDVVVPKAQAEAIVAALRRNGVPHEYHLYPGEGHGWRTTETIRSFYESLLAFLKQYVLFS
ncbi:MAG: S9 family peptidase [Chloroflexi bacterium]|nr:S9 family peptidase [Chloroflexota bacterium]